MSSPPSSLPKAHHFPSGSTSRLPPDPNAGWGREEELWLGDLRLVFPHVPPPPCPRPQRCPTHQPGPILASPPPPDSRRETPPRHGLADLQMAGLGAGAATAECWVPETPAPRPSLPPAFASPPPALTTIFCTNRAGGGGPCGRGKSWRLWRRQVFPQARSLGTAGLDQRAAAPHAQGRPPTAPVCGAAAGSGGCSPNRLRLRPGQQGPGVGSALPLQPQGPLGVSPAPRPPPPLWGRPWPARSLGPQSRCSCLWWRERALAASGAGARCC
jgi:hypothetical protein